MYGAPPGVTDRLAREFGAGLRPGQLDEIVESCLRDLDGQVPAPALPEFTERLARARLARLVSESERPATVPPRRAS